MLVGLRATTRQGWAPGLFSRWRTRQSNKSSFSQGSARSSRNQGTISGLINYISWTHAMYVCVLVQGRPAAASAAVVGQLHRHTCCWSTPEHHDRPRSCPVLASGTTRSISESGYTHATLLGGGIVQAAVKADILALVMTGGHVLVGRAISRSSARHLLGSGIFQLVASTFLDSERPTSWSSLARSLTRAFWVLIRRSGLVDLDFSLAVTVPFW